MYYTTQEYLPTPEESYDFFTRQWEADPEQERIDKERIEREKREKLKEKEKAKGGKKEKAEGGDKEGDEEEEDKDKEEDEATTPKTPKV